MRIQHRHLIAASMAVIGIPQLAIAGAMRDPFFAVVTIVALVLGTLALRFDRWWAVVPALAGGVIVIAITPLQLPALQHIDSFFDFAPAVAGLAGASAAVVLAVADLAARWRDVPGVERRNVVRGFAGGVAALACLAAVSGLVTLSSRSTVSASDRADAQVVTYKDSKVEQTSLEATAGQPIRIVVENEDLILHDFDVEGVDVRFDLGPRDQKLAEFTINTPGEYEYRCTLHTDMSGILVVR